MSLAMNTAPLQPVGLVSRSAIRWAAQFAPLFALALLVFLPAAGLQALNRLGVGGGGLVEVLNGLVRVLGPVVLSGLVAARLVGGQARGRIEDLAYAGLRSLGSVLLYGYLPGIVVVLGLNTLGLRDQPVPTRMLIAGTVISLACVPAFARIALAGPALVVENLSPKASVERAIALSAGSRLRLGAVLFACQLADHGLQVVAARTGLPMLGHVLVVLAVTALSASFLAVVLTDAFEDRRGQRPAEVGEVFA
jgi:hypothetical protein